MKRKGKKRSGKENKKNKGKNRTGDEVGENKGRGKTMRGQERTGEERKYRN